MNTEVSAVTGFPPYEMVFGRKPRANYFILESLFEQSITQEEDLPKDLDVESSYEKTQSQIQQEMESNNEQQVDQRQWQDDQQRQYDQEPRQDDQQQQRQDDQQ